MDKFDIYNLLKLMMDIIFFIKKEGRPTHPNGLHIQLHPNGEALSAQGGLLHFFVAGSAHI